VGELVNPNCRSISPERQNVLHIDLPRISSQYLHMKFDISDLLAQWDYQPGQVMVRKFKGKDGQEKIQLRVDLGLLQMNAQGRPDGKRPMGFETLHDFYLDKLDQHLTTHQGHDDRFRLTAEDCARLQLEVLQYHHRYICLIQLDDYDSAIRDTEHNLEIIDFVSEYAENDDLAWSLEQFRPQVIMLRTRARACQKLDTKNFPQAIREIEDGLKALREFFHNAGRGDIEDQSPEILSLRTWLEDVKNQRPLTRREKLELDLQRAIQVEDFERAARVRDALRNLKSPDK
jgi:tetratricopeptide (TPR) repeat protein